MYDLEELVEHLYFDVEYGRSVFDEKVAKMIMSRINHDAYYILRDCENLCEEEDSEVYKNLVLECSELVDDLEYFNGSDEHFYELLDNLRNKLNEIMKLLSPNHDDFSNELSDKLYDIYLLCDFY